MSFLHAGVLAGLAAIAIPIVLHLLMRQKPKKLDFPALRLLQSSVRESTKRLRLRHLWLLALRMLLIAAVVFAVARPTLPAASWMPPWWAIVGTIAVLAVAIAADRGLTQRIDRSEVAAGRREARRKRTRWILWPVALGLLLVAVGWPYARRVEASMQSAPTAEEIDLPVAAVFVFDVSPSVGYERDGRTRLQLARQTVTDHVGRLPGGSRAAIVTNARRPNSEVAVFQRTLSGVPTQLARLEPVHSTITLNEAIAKAVDLHTQDRRRLTADGAASARYVRRTYVVTDLQMTAWQFPDDSGLEAKLAEESTIGLFLLDVGLDAVANRALTDLRLSKAEVVDGGPLIVQSRAEVTGEPGGVADAELVLQVDEKPITRGRETLDGSRVLVFETTIERPSETPSESSLEETAEVGGAASPRPDRVNNRQAGFRQGDVVIRGTDPLPFDDRQPFTVAVSKLPRVLVVASEVAETSEFVAALEVSAGGPSRYGLTVATPADLTAKQLEETDIVALINVAELADGQWQALRQFVADGGGIAVFLGSFGIESFSYNRAAAQQVLPAELDVHLSRGRFDPDHPLFTSDSNGLVDQLRPDDVASILESAEVKRYWRVQPRDDAQVFARLAEEDVPLLLERRIESGLVVMMTTAIDAKPSRERWNNFISVPGAPWVRLVFLDKLMRYLSRTRDDRFNFLVTETPRLPLGDALRAAEAPKLLTPDLLSLPIVREDDAETLRLPQATQPGHYRVRADGRTLAAFSVRADPSESDLTRADSSDLDSILGKDRYQLARNLDELNEEIDLTEYGQEAFPFLMLLAAFAYAAELWLGARFYGD